MGMKFRIGDLVCLRFDNYKDYRIKYGVITETGFKVPPTTAAYTSNKTKTSAYISVIWIGTTRKHTIYKEFLKTMWDRTEIIARA